MANIQFISVFKKKKNLACLDFLPLKKFREQQDHRELLTLPQKNSIWQHSSELNEAKDKTVKRKTIELYECF